MSDANNHNTSNIEEIIRLKTKMDGVAIGSVVKSATVALIVAFLN